jgi:hypothetical protein
MHNKSSDSSPLSKSAIVSHRGRFSKRRPTVADDQRAGWIARISRWIVTVEPSRIVNRDETSWLLHPKGILTSAERGCQAVQAKINGEEKECITVVA